MHESRILVAHSVRRSKNVSGGDIGGKSDWKGALRAGGRHVMAEVALTRLAEGRPPVVDYSSSEEIAQDEIALRTYNEELWAAGAPLRQYLAERRYAQYEWSAMGEGGAPPEG